MTHQDVLERNVARLFARAYRPLEVRPAFRSDLRSRCLEAARAAGAAPPTAGDAARRSTRHGSWRPALVLAAAGLAALVGWRVLGGAFDRDDAAGERRLDSLAAILSSGRVALRVVDGRAATTDDGAAWRTAEPGAATGTRLALELGALGAAAVLEVVTPDATPSAADASQAAARAPRWSFDLGLDAEPGAGLLLDRDTRVVLRRGGPGSVAIELEHGRLQAQRPLHRVAAPPWRLAGPADRAAALRFERGALSLSWRPGEACALALLTALETDPRTGGAQAARALDARGRALPLDEWVSLCAGELRTARAGGDRREPVASAARPAAEPAREPDGDVALRLVPSEPDGDPLPDGPVAVVLLPAVELPPRIEPVTRAARAVDGRVLLADVPDWTESIALVVPGRALARLDRLSFGEPRPAGPQELDVALEAGHSLVGRVVEAATGAPVPGAVVVSDTDAPFDHLPLTLEDLPAAYAARAVTDAEGRFELAHLRAGAHRLRAAAPGFAPTTGAATCPADVGSDEVVLRLRTGGSIAGRLEDEDCAPVAGAVVVISPQEVNHGPPYYYGLAVTDAQGDYRFDDVAAGEYVVVRTGAQVQSALMSAIDVLQASVQQGVETRADWTCAPELASVSGRVRTVDGDPLANRILVFSPSASTDGATGWSSTLVDAQGEYAITGLAPGDYDLLITTGLPSDVVRVGRLELPFEGSHEHDVTVGQRRVEGVVRLAGEPPPTGSFVVLLEQDLQRDGSFRFMAQKLTASQGSWSVPYLHAGRYRVRVIPISGVAKASEALEFTVGDEDPEPLEVVLTPGAALAVRVVDATGAAVAAARLAAVGGDGRSVMEVNRSGTDSDGRGEVFGLAPGRVRLRVSAEGYADAELEIELAPGERHELDVALERP